METVFPRIIERFITTGGGGVKDGLKKGGMTFLFWEGGLPGLAGKAHLHVFELGGRGSPHGQKDKDIWQQQGIQASCTTSLEPKVMINTYIDTYLETYLYDFTHTYACMQMYVYK